MIALFLQFEAWKSLMERPGDCKCVLMELIVQSFDYDDISWYLAHCHSHAIIIVGTPRTRPIASSTKFHTPHQLTKRDNKWKSKILADATKAGAAIAIGINARCVGYLLLQRMIQHFEEQWIFRFRIFRITHAIGSSTRWRPSGVHPGAGGEW